jgi:hypothetical protein
LMIARSICDCVMSSCVVGAVAVFYFESCGGHILHLLFKELDPAEQPSSIFLVCEVSDMSCGWNIVFGFFG